MLVSFSVANFRSFRDEVTLNMTAANYADHPDHVIRGEGQHPELLTCAALYGANASGKSNLIEAMIFARDLAVHGRRPDERLNPPTFRLDPTCADAPTSFEFIFIVDGAQYRYGMEINAEIVLAEWLYSKDLAPRKREVMWFERQHINGDVSVEFGKALRGDSSKDAQFMEFIARGTRKNQTFFAELAEKNSTKTFPIRQWLLHNINPWNTKADSAIFVPIKSIDNFISFLSEAANNSNLGISKFKLKKTLSPSLDQLSILHYIKNTAAHKSSLFSLSTNEEVLIADTQNNTISRIQGIRQNSLGEDIAFEFTDESDGTRRFIMLIPTLYDMAHSNNVYVIDELDRRLHSMLSRNILSSFIESCVSGARSQLIFTTHDTHLLDQDLLRRDEVWFVEKDADHASHLYSLAEFNVRSDLNLERGYLDGRFGAIPYLGRFSFCDEVEGAGDEAV